MRLLRHSMLAGVSDTEGGGGVDVGPQFHYWITALHIYDILRPPVLAAVRGGWCGTGRKGRVGR